jgi:MYXO-CTERM domain-containing protein
MSTRVVLAGAAAALVMALAAPAPADPIAADSFRVGPGGHAAGDLTPQNPPVEGFTGAWQDGTSPTDNWAVFPAGLTHPAVMHPTGGAVQYLGGEGTHRAHRSLDSYSAPGGDVVYYMSGLVRLESDIDQSGLSLMGFTNKQGLTDDQFFNATSDNQIQGLQWGLEGTGGQIDLVLRHRQQRSGIGIRQFTDVLVPDVQVGDTHLVLLKLEMNEGNGSGGNDFVSVWVNPATVTSEAAAGAPDFTFWDYSLFGSTAIDSLVVGKNSLATFFTYDEPRFGTTWEDVAPVPEPATLTLLALGALPLLRRRGRKPRGETR